MRSRKNLFAIFSLLLVIWMTPAAGQVKTKAAAEASHPARPKLIVMIVVDQMRADYIEKFQGQWNGGLKRMVNEGAWFRSAAYPYAATETCVGHATISTGSFPNAHGMIGNSWWDRDLNKSITCTFDPKAKNIAYAGGTAKDGDSAARMMMPSFAEELKFQTGGATRVVALSLKARASITLAGHSADAVTWYDGGSWITSSVYGSMPFMEEFASKHPVATDYGKEWTPALPQMSYLYDDKAIGAADLGSFGATLPHPLKGKEGSSAPDETFYQQWTASPFADTYLTNMAEAAIDSLGLGKGAGTDYLGISYSTVDYVGHAFGPRSHEIQDVLIRLDRDLGGLLDFLDKKVGRGNYIVALSADHGVAPIPSDMQKTGVSAGVLNVAELQQQIEKALEKFDVAHPAVARISSNDLYFAPGVYDKLKQNPEAMNAVLKTISDTPGVETVLTSDEVAAGTKSLLEIRDAFAWSFFPGRSGDLFVLQKPYWLMGSSNRSTGTSHGTPYYYDRRVPIVLFGFGVQPGQYFERVTPADIAPTFSALTGITLAGADGRVLSEALKVAHSHP